MKGKNGDVILRKVEDEFMKLRNIMVAALLAGVLALTGCGKTQSDSNTNSSATFAVTDEMAEEYVTLGEYKGLELTKYISEVTDEDVDYAREMFMEDYRVDSEVSDRGIEKDDYVTISLTETPDGSDDMDYGDVDIQVGQAEFSQAMDDALIGHTAGETVTVEDTTEDDNGEEIKTTYTAKINSVYTVSYPEYNDDFVKENTEYATKQELDDSFVKQVQEENEESSVDNLRDSALTAIVEKSEFNELPEDLLDKSYDEVKASYESYASMFGAEVSDIIGEDELQSLAEVNLQEKLVVQALVKAEAITKDDDSYAAFIRRYINYMEVDSEDELMEYYTKEELEELYYREKALDAVIASAIVKEEAAPAEEDEDEALESEEKQVDTQDISLEE